MSHQGVKSKNKLILRLMEALVFPNPAAYRGQLIRFSALNHTTHSELALKASQLLDHTKLSELRTSIARSMSELEMFARRISAINERMEDLVSAPLAVEDALMALFDHSDPTLQRRVVETYIRRLYQGTIRLQWHGSGHIASWELSGDHTEKRNAFGHQIVEKHSERRWVAMVITKLLQLLRPAITATLKESVDADADKDLSNGFLEHANEGNMLHIALVGINNQMSSLQDSGDEDQAHERINKLAMILKEDTVSSDLQNAGVSLVSCIIQRDERRAYRGTKEEHQCVIPSIYQLISFIMRKNLYFATWNLLFLLSLNWKN